METLTIFIQHNVSSFCNVTVTHDEIHKQLELNVSFTKTIDFDEKEDITEAMIDMASVYVDNKTLDAASLCFDYPQEYHVNIFKGLLGDVKVVRER